MDASKILSILYSEIHSVVVGMIDSEGHPSSTFVKDDETWYKRNSAYQEFLKQALTRSNIHNPGHKKIAPHRRLMAVWEPAFFF